MPQSRVYTYADLLAMPVDNQRREILDGELIVSPSPFVRHQEIVGRLYLALGNHVVAHGGGKVYLGPTDVVLSDVNVVEPDVLFIADDRLEILTERNLTGAPSLVVEVVSDARRDRVRKRDLYTRFGVPEYWVVDPDADRVEIHRLGPDGYGKPEILEPGETLTYERLPGLAIDLGLLFTR